MLYALLSGIINTRALAAVVAVAPANTDTTFGHADSAAVAAATTIAAPSAAASSAAAVRAGPADGPAATAATIWSHDWRAQSADYDERRAIRFTAAVCPAGKTICLLNILFLFCWLVVWTISFYGIRMCWCYLLMLSFIKCFSSFSDISFLLP